MSNVLHADLTFQLDDGPKVDEAGRGGHGVGRSSRCGGAERIAERSRA